MRNLLFMLFAFAALSGQAQPKILYYDPPPKGFAERKIAKSGLKKDMDFWQKVLEESHVNLYHSITKAKLDSLKKAILRSVPDSLTHAEASFAISRLSGAIGEGHLGFTSNPVSDSLYKSQSLRFPYILQGFDNGAFVVRQDVSGNHPPLPSQSSIVEINGIPAQQLYDRYAAFTGGLEAWKKLNVAESIRKLLFLDNIRSPFVIKALKGKDTVSISSKGFSGSQADSISKVVASSYSIPSAFSLQFLPGNIALISFNDMNGRLRDSFAIFLKKSFAEIGNKKAGGLIIDLRQNGGGDSGLGDMLLSYISSHPYRNVSAIKVKVSRHSKALAKLREKEDPFSKSKNGSLFEYKIDKLTTPEEQPLRFTGKTAVLIGTGTFSSANMLANTIKDYKLATLIGEPTAEPGNDFGEVFPFMLPNTRVIATGSIKMFVRANGDASDFTGIQPDIFSATGIGDKGKDQVMEDAIKYLGNK